MADFDLHYLYQKSNNKIYIPLIGLLAVFRIFYDAFVIRYKNVEQKIMKLKIVLHENDFVKW